jgi:hypothetical protein
MAAHFFYKCEAGQKAFWGGVTTPPKTVWADGDADPLNIEITEGVLGSLASPEEEGHFEFGLEGLVLRGMPLPGGVGTSGNGSFGGLITLKLEVAIPGQEDRLVSAPIDLRVAPWLLIPNTQPAEEVYVSEITDSGQTKPALDILGATLVPFQGSHWLQDHAEIGYTQRPGADPMFLTFGTPYSMMNTSTYGQQPVPENWVKERFLAPDSGIFHLTNLPDDRRQDWGGNIEALPPTVPPRENEPLGSVIVGHGEKHQMSHALLHFLEAQEFQPVKKVNVDFASVQHVDEVISVGANGVIYYADPKLAIELLEDKFPTPAENAAAEEKAAANVEKIRGCFFDALGQGRGVHKVLGHRVVDDNHLFMIQDEVYPSNPQDIDFVKAYEEGTVRTVHLGFEHGGQIGRIQTIQRIETQINNYDDIDEVGKTRINLDGIWQPGRALAPHNWSTPALLPWGHASTTTFQEAWHK